MRNATPVTVFEGITRLVPQTFEASLKSAEIYFATPDPWSRKVQERGLLFDLSALEWVDLGPVVQLVLLCENAVRAGVAVQVKLPDPLREVASGSAANRGDHALSVRLRAGLLSFLSTIGFEQALHMPHVAGSESLLSVIRGGSPPRTVPSVARPSRKLSDEPRHKFCFPLKWITGDDPGDLELVANFLAQVVGEAERGLQALDAQAISNVILHELRQNILEHGGKATHALVAAWARPSTQLPAVSDFLEPERLFLDWVRQSRTALIEIVVGDSGAGLAKQLEPSFLAASRKTGALAKRSNYESETILWSFERWSTSKKPVGLRGTRGLYRVARVVGKYRGLVTIRAGTAIAGFDYSPEGPGQPISAEGYAPIPGTIVRVRMPPFKELKTRLRSRPSGLPPLVSRFLPFKTYSETGLNPEDAQTLSTPRAPSANQALLELSCVSFDGGPARREAIEFTLRQLAEVHHPYALVALGFAGGWDLVESAVNSVNEECERDRKHRDEARRDSYDIWDPLLVLGPNGECAWVGGTEGVRRILGLLLDYDRIAPEEMSKLFDGDFEAERETRMMLSRDRATTAELTDGSIVSRFSAQSLCEEIVSLTTKHLETGSDGVLAGPWVTPSLGFVQNWYDVPTILRRTCGPRFAAWALLEKLGSRLGEELSGATALAADGEGSDELLRALADHVPQLKVAGGSILGAPEAPSERSSRSRAVLIVTDLIGSSESSYRAAAEELRRGGSPVAIAALIDTRQAQTDLNVWGRSIPVISLVHLTVESPSETQRARAKYRAPLSSGAEEELLASTKNEEYAFTHDELIGLLTERNLLHFSHVRGTRGRHFTFYLQSRGFTELPEVCRRIAESIDLWLNDIAFQGPPDESLEIWIPASGALSDGLERAVARVKNELQVPCRTVRVVRREVQGGWIFGDAIGASNRQRPVVVLDWGAITGESVSAMAQRAAETGASPILACIVLSQLSAADERFLASISTLAVDRKARVEQLDLFTGDSSEATLRATAAVTFRFIARLAIEAYSSPTTCPVCEQLTRIEMEDFPTKLLEEFRRKQENQRLRVRSAAEALAAPGADLSGRPLGAGSATWMLRLRTALRHAELSTRGRLRIREDLARMAEANPERGPSDECVWLMRFLSVEVQWFRRHPLLLRSCRKILAQIALRVATDQSCELEDRLNALIVLRTASKDSFAAAIPKLIEAAAGNRPLIDQTIYAAFTFASRPYIRSKTSYQPLRESLRRVREELVGSRIEDLGEVTETIDSLVSKIDFKVLSSEAERMSLPARWNRLRAFYRDYHRHHGLAESLRKVFPGPDASSIEKAIAENLDISPACLRYLKELPRYWAECLRHLDGSLYPLLKRLAETIATYDCETSMGFPNSQWLTSLLASGDSFQASRLSTLVNSLRDNPEHLRAPGVWEGFLEELNLIWTNIVEPRDAEKSGARIRQFLDSGAISLSDLAQVFRDEAKRRPDGIALDLEALRTCDGDPVLFGCRSLFESLAEVTLANCLRYRKRMDLPVDVRVSCSAGADGVEILVQNSNSQASPESEHGIGLSRLRARVRAFAGDLSHDECAGIEHWTYCVSASFGLALFE